MSNLQNSSQNIQQQKRKYDDITYQKRCQLIQLIEQQKWTIKAAAKEIGIKLCTAKHILYLYRRKGKIYKKKGEFQQEQNNQLVPPAPIIQYVPIFIIPFPYFIPQKLQDSNQKATSTEQSVHQPERPHQFSAFRSL